jgi:hypothetical protein
LQLISMRRRIFVGLGIFVGLRGGIQTSMRSADRCPHRTMAIAMVRRDDARGR